MKKLNQLAIWILAAAVAGVAQQTTTPSTAQQPAPGSQPGQTTAPTTDQQAAQPQKKEIKDPAEYNAYMAAMDMKDPSQAAAKAAALEQFITQYPNSVVKDDALEQLMIAYQQANNQVKAQDAAVRVLKVNPNN